VTLLFRETNKSYAPGIVAKKRMSLFEKFSAKRNKRYHVSRKRKVSASSRRMKIAAWIAET